MSIQLLVLSFLTSVALAGNNTWSQIASLPTTTVSVFATDPQQPDLIYAGGQDGVWKSTDYGLTWTSINNGLPSTCSGSSYCRSVTALAVSPADSAPWVSVQTGLYRYDSQLNTWTFRGPAPDAYGAVRVFNSIAFNASTVYVGHRNGASPGLGILKSSDAGANWSAITDNLVPGQIASSANRPDLIVVAKSNPAVLYAACSNCANAVKGFFRSTDGGASWSAIDGGALGSISYSGYVGGMVVDPADAMHLWVVSASNSAGPKGLFASTDGGANWSLLDSNAYAFWNTPGASVSGFAGSRVFFRNSSGGLYWRDSSTANQSTSLSKSGVMGFGLTTDAAGQTRLIAGTTGSGGVWEYTFAVPTNGSCGTAHGGSFATAPTSNFCAVGAATTVTGSGPWSWSCLGSNSGTNVSCSANLSAAASYTLNITKEGAGAGVVTSAPAGINCGSDCSENYDSGTSTTLTAVPASGSIFVGWSGVCSGTAVTCSLTMDAAKSVTATFASATSGRYTKIANNGSELPDSAVLGTGATQWGCTRDNTTGLIWEIKTNDGGLRDLNKLYTNYDDPTQPQIWNGSTQAYVGPTFTEINAASNSIGFANAVNASTLCAAADWRLPSKDELSGTVDIAYRPTIDLSYFPDTRISSSFWSSSPDIWPTDARSVNFQFGNFNVARRDFAQGVRLVRSGHSLVPSAPTCTVTANPASVSAGSASTLTASCSPAATSYVWSGGTCVGTTASTCTVTPTATTTYTVAGVNAGGTGSAASATVTMAALPTVTSVTPLTARLDVAQDFIVRGTNLTSGMGFAVDDCESSSVEVGTGSSTQRTFRCTPRLPGPKNVVVKTAPGGTTLFSSASPATAGAMPINIDHPARLGNVASRGIPEVLGVSQWNGNVHVEATDLTVPGRGVSFTLTRSYNSYDSALEANHGSVSQAAPWRFNWDLMVGYVKRDDNSNDTSKLWVQREDGSGENFIKDATDGIWYPVDQGNFNTLKGNTPVVGQTTLLTREGLQYIFQNPDLGGKLIKILDHDGNGLTVTRDASGRVGTVTDASGRVYTFSYYPNTVLLWKVTDFTGSRYVEYTWETGASSVRLKTVRDVRGGITTYNYLPLQTSTLAQSAPAAQFLLTSIIDPVGNQAATPYAARTFTYTDKVYGNWGAKSVTDAIGNTWKFVYCANQTNSSSCSNGASQIDPTGATSFETRVTPPLGAGAATTTRFDTGGRLTEQVDANAKTSKTTPMGLANLTTKTYSLAALATKKQSARGALAANNYGTVYDYVKDASGKVDKVGNLLSVTDAENATTLRTWLSGTTQAAALAAKNLQRVARFSTATGAQHAFTHTDSGNVQTYTPPGLNAIALSYDNAGQVTSVKDGRNNTSTRTYDVHGNLTKVTGPDGRAVENTYDALGRILTTKDKRGAITTNTWDAAGNLTSVKNALNGIESYDYDANGNRIRMTDARGNVTHYTYDRANRLKTVQRINGTQILTTTTHYDVMGRVTSTVNANGHADNTTFDGEGNVLTRANALADTTSYVYDEDNRVIQTTDPAGRVTNTTYDRVGRVKTVITAAGTTRYDYDLDGRMTKSTDPRGNATQYAYDPAGRLIAVTDANNQITRASYDANGNMLAVADPNNRTTTYTYDALNRPLTRTDANGQQWSTTYDENGNVITQTVPGPSGPRTTTFTYDALNRVSQVVYPDTSVVSYTYDANGNRLSMTDSTGTTRYAYDALNRMSSKTDPQGKVVSYAYDGVGNVTTLGYPGGQSVRYAYDAGERLVSLTDWLGKTTSYTLNRAGQVTAAAMGNNTRADMAYDSAGRQISLINRKADGSILSSHGLTLDANGNITNSTTTLPLQPSLPNVNRAFTYDGANRLATYNGGAVTHDVAGRMTTLAGDSYSYNDRDQITAVSGTQSASYAYNGEGHRVTRTINGQTTRFVIDPNRDLPEVLVETDSAGNVLRNYVYGYGLVAQIDNTNAVKYYHFDPTGSTLALTNATGVVTDSYAYTPYGETTASGSTVNPFRYVGKLGVIDDGNGLQFMRARYYRPDVARFMSLDQLAGEVSNPQSLNRYAYVQGNPVAGVDPSGLCKEGRKAEDCAKIAAIRMKREAKLREARLSQSNSNPLGEATKFSGGAVLGVGRCWVKFVDKAGNTIAEVVNAEIDTPGNTAANFFALGADMKKAGQTLWDGFVAGELWSQIAKDFKSLVSAIVNLQTYKNGVNNTVNAVSAMNSLMTEMRARDASFEFGGDAGCVVGTVVARQLSKPISPILLTGTTSHGANRYEILKSSLLQAQ